MLIGGGSRSSAPGTFVRGSNFDTPLSKIPTLNSTYGCAIDVTRGEVLYQKAATTVYEYPASTVKIMTALLLAELKVGSMSSTVTWQTSDDLASGFSQVGFINGDVVTFTDLMHGMLMVSGGDASQAVARVLGNEALSEAPTSTNGYAEFVNMMNARALELGCQSTVFSNSHGAETHEATARDMALITGACFRNALIDSLARDLSYDINVTGSNARTIGLTNSIPTLGIEGVKGTKTGSLSGGPYPTTFSLVTLWTAPNGNDIAIVNLAATTSSDRYDDTSGMITSLQTDFPYLAG